MKKIIVILLSAIMAIALVACGGKKINQNTVSASKTNQTSNGVSSSNDEPSNNISSNMEDKSVIASDLTTPIEYDKLQELFLYIDETISKEDIVNMVESAGLFYTEEHYNNGKTVLRIAYTEGASLQRYADSGDHLEVAFDDLNDYDLEYMTYDNSSSSTALYYRYGTWYEFNFNRDNLTYSGCYVFDPFSDGGITIKYENGNESSTRYFQFDSKEAVINELVIDSQEQQPPQ